MADDSKPSDPPTAAEVFGSNTPAPPARLTADPALPEAVARRGVSEAAWRTLCDNLYPGANPRSVLMVVDYCAARQLDPLKKPVHIVPMRVKVNGEYMWRDVVMPGVYEHRITAQRTGEYLGHSRPEYGPVIEVLGVSAPEWCTLTVYRWNAFLADRVSFPVCVYFREVVATTSNKGGREAVNDRWSRAPIQMLTKCAEAAALREAFPEELGGQHTDDELAGRALDDDDTPAVPVVRRRSDRQDAAPSPDVLEVTP